MALTREQKSVQLTELKEKFGTASSVIFTNYIGLNVADVSALRRKLRTAGAEMKVAKKTLMQIASKEKGLPEAEETMMNGAVACIFSFADPLSGAQAAFAFSKDHPQVAFLGGIFDGKLLSQTQAKEFAKMPGRPVLLATFALLMRSPLASFTSICNSPLTGFARAMSEMAKKKQPA